MSFLESKDNINEFLLKNQKKVLLNQLQNECVICYESLSGRPLILLDCQHVGHFECYQKIDKCPLCRKRTNIPRENFIEPVRVDLLNTSSIRNIVDTFSNIRLGNINLGELITQLAYSRDSEIPSLWLKLDEIRQIYRDKYAISIAKLYLLDILSGILIFAKIYYGIDLIYLFLIIRIFLEIIQCFLMILLLFSASCFEFVLIYRKYLSNIINNKFLIGLFQIIMLVCLFGFNIFIEPFYTIFCAKRYLTIGIYLIIFYFIV